MARVFTSSVPTDTLFDIQTITSESTFRSRARVTQLTTITQEEVELDEDGDLVTVTEEVESTVLSTSTSTGTRTRTITSSIPVQTLYSLSLSTSTPDDDDDDETTSTTASLSLSRQPLMPTLSSSSSTSEDDVVVVTQFTTITPTQATTTSLSPTLSSGTSRNPVFPNGQSSSSRVSPSAANDDAASSRSSSSSLLSSGAIAGIAVGAVAVAVLLGILGFLFCCRRRNNRRDSMYATTGGRSDEKLAPALFNPDYSHNQAQATRTRSSGANSRHQLLMANVGGAGASALSAGAAGVGAGRSSNRFSAGGREERNNAQFGKNKPVPDVPPPVSALQYMRPAPGQRGISDDVTNAYSNTPNRVHYANQPMAAAGLINRPSTASPALATQGPYNAPGNRTSAPIGGNTSLPVQTPQEKSDALKRAKSVASVKSIPAENLGKGAGYASPMAPIDPLGKPIDQKTWRERTSKINSGEFWTPDTMLTNEQKLRRDSQLAKLQAIRDGTASSKPNLGKLKEEKEEQQQIFETSPLLGGDNSFDSTTFNSPERVSAIYPLQNQTSRGSQPSTSKRPDSTATILPYTSNAEASTSYRPPSGPLPAIPTQPPRSPPPSNAIYPSLPPNSPSRNAALSQSTPPVSPSKQPRYELHQPLAQSHNPIRASFISAPHQSYTVTGGPPPAASSQAFNNRLPAIPGSRPSSMVTSNTTLPEYRRSSTASFAGGNSGNNAQTPYTAASPQVTPFFQHHNGSNGSFGTSRSSQNQQQQTVSLADEIYGGLTKGLSERDLLRLSQPLQSQNKK